MTDDEIRETLETITRTEVLAVNYTLDTNGRACPGPVLAPWAFDLGTCVQVSQQQVMLAAMQGQANPDNVFYAICDYLVVAFRIGYEAGRQKLEIPPCNPSVDHDD